MFVPSKPVEKPVPKDYPQGRLPRALPAIATHAYAPRDVLELKLKANQRLHIVEAKGDWWYIARTMHGLEGWVPSSYIKPLDSPSNLNMTDTYKAWSAAVAYAFRNAPLGLSKEELNSYRIDIKTFPYLPPDACACEQPTCRVRKQDSPLGACIHDVECLLRGAGEEYSAAWLRKMSLAWHPDKFVKKFRERFKMEGVKAVSEMFAILTELSIKERERERETTAKMGGAV